MLMTPRTPWTQKAQKAQKAQRPVRRKVKPIKTYVTQITTGKEEYMRNLLQQFMPGFRIWIPTKPYAYIQKVQGVKDSQYERRILFPGYILIDGESYDELYDILTGLKFHSFFNLVGKKGGPSALRIVRDNELSIIKQLSGEELSKGIIENKRIRFVSGPFVGLEPLVRKIDRHHSKIMFQTEMFGRQMDIWVGAEIVVPVEE